MDMQVHKGRAPARLGALVKPQAALRQQNRRQPKLRVTDRVRAAAADTAEQAGHGQSRRALSSRKLGSLYLTLLPGQLQYLPAFLAPASVVISCQGAMHGDAWVHWLLSLLPVPQSIMELPPVNFLEVLYGQHPGLGDGLLRSLVSLAGVAFAFVLMPGMDFLLGRDLQMFSEEEHRDAAGDRGYRALLWTWALAHCGLVALCCDAAGHHDMFPLAVLGMTASLGSSAAIGFAVSHELTHGGSRLDKAMADLLLCIAFYMHWRVSHMAHHAKVATPEDPASARLGETLYAFVPRSITGNLQDGVAIELARMRSKGQSPCSLHNRMLLWAAAPGAMTAAVGCACGPRGLLVLLGQALISVVLLEAVNYIEHYGLRRKRLLGGRYERVAKEHSWDANWMFTSSCLFALQRHADHHVHATKPYQVLKATPTAPQLPVSYPGMILLAAVPGLFFRIMNPRVTALRLAEEQADHQQLQ